MNHERNEKLLYQRRKHLRKLKAIKQGWAYRMRAARGQGPKGWVSPSILAYGRLVDEYTYWQRRVKHAQGFAARPPVPASWECPYAWKEKRL